MQLVQLEQRVRSLPPQEQPPAKSDVSAVQHRQIGEQRSYSSLDNCIMQVSNASRAKEKTVRRSSQQRPRRLGRLHVPTLLSFHLYRRE